MWESKGKLTVAFLSAVRLKCSSPVWTSKVRISAQIIPDYHKVEAGGEVVLEGPIHQYNPSVTPAIRDASIHV